MRILVTGSVAAGKSTVTKLLSEHLPTYKVFNISDIVIDNKLYCERDERFDSLIPCDDRLLNWFVDNVNQEPNIIVDHHSFDIFGDRYFSLIVIVKCQDANGDFKTLRKRLVERKYSEDKILENLECEIMSTCAEDARRFKGMKFEFNNSSQQMLEKGIDDLLGLIKRMDAGEIIVNQNRLAECVAC